MGWGKAIQGGALCLPCAHVTLGDIHVTNGGPRVTPTPVPRSKS